MSISPGPGRYPWQESTLLLPRALLPAEGPRVVMGPPGVEGCEAGAIPFTLVSFYLQQHRTENPAVCWWLELWNPGVSPCTHGWITPGLLSLFPVPGALSLSEVVA